MLKFISRRNLAKFRGKGGEMFNIQDVTEFGRHIQRGDSMHQKDEKLPQNMGSQTTYFFKNASCSTLTECRLTVILSEN